MNFKKFDIIIVSNGYSDKLRASLYYWMLMNYSKANYRVIVATSSKDKATLECLSSYQERSYGSLIVVPHVGNNYHNKGLLMSECCKIAQNTKSDLTMFTDADMIFYPDLLVRLSLSYLENGMQLTSSTREDIDPEDLDLFMENYSRNNVGWIWDNVKRKIESPSPFMGWFLVFPSSIRENLDFNEDHSGYDIVDWKMFGQLKNMGLKENMIHLDNSPLHIHHGPKGANWRGLNFIDDINA